MARDLRLVLMTPVHPPSLGTRLTFQLLRRGRTTIIPQPHGVVPAAAAAAAAATEAEEAQAATPGRAGGKAGKAGSATAVVALQPQQHPLAANRWAKFAVAGGACATALWREAAKELADHAQEVRGGLGGRREEERAGHCQGS